MLMNTLRIGLDRILAFLVMLLIAGISIVVVLGFTTRLLGFPLSWTDEIAGIGLAWLTFYGSALAASRGAHIASPSLVAIFPKNWRVAVILLAEACTIAFLLLLAITGMEVIHVLQGSNLVSLPFISQQLSQSAVPIGAGLFILAELLRLPEIIKLAAAGENVSETDAEDDIF